MMRKVKIKEKEKWEVGLEPKSFREVVKLQQLEDKAEHVPEDTLLPLAGRLRGKPRIFKTSVLRPSAIFERLRHELHFHRHKAKRMAPSASDPLIFTKPRGLLLST